MTAELKGIHAKTFQDLDVIKDVLKLDEEKIAELEKENAELREKLKPENCLKLLAKEGYIKFTSEQLTKAKDHIKKLLDCLKQDTNDPQTNYYVCQYMDKAEQFLSEVEK